MPMQWSKYQEKIFSSTKTILKQDKDLVVLARAGTGKTTTMVEAVIRFCKSNPSKRVLTCAFNKKNADELGDKLAKAGLNWKKAQAKTLNSVGLACVRKNFGKDVDVDPRKGYKIAKSLAKNNEDTDITGLRRKIAKLASIAKATLTDPNNEQRMSALCWEYWITDDYDEISTVVSLARQAMEMSALNNMVVDFDDMLWFPHVHNLWPWLYHVVIVDEAQDMNPAQLELARKSTTKNGRLIAVGDQKQAIYGWRGADSEFLDRMIKNMGAKTLTLPVTYRCAKNIVEEAKKYVPDYQAFEENEEGVVENKTLSFMEAEAKPGDFIISRLNAPLLGNCLSFLKRDIPAVIQGRDIMANLMSIIKFSKQDTVKDFLEWLDKYEENEIAKMQSADVEEEQISVFRDKCQCLRILSPECKTTDELIDKLDNMFSDYDDTSVITLSTAHRSKGLERDRVFVLRDTFRPEQGGQEENCLYVAITRAKNALYYIG